MNEDLNTMLLRLVQENIQTNQQWSQTAAQFLNKLGDAIKADTEYMRQSIQRIEGMIGKLEISQPDEPVIASETEIKDQGRTTQGRYPASFYFRHKFPQDAAAPGYYLLITEEGDQLQYQLFDQQWKPVHAGIVQDKSMDTIQAAVLIADMEGISEYLRYEMYTDAVMENVRSVAEPDVSEKDVQKAVIADMDKKPAAEEITDERQIEAVDLSVDETRQEITEESEVNVKEEQEEEKPEVEGSRHDRTKTR